MSNSRLDKYVKPMEPIMIQKKVAGEMDDFWDDCMDYSKQEGYEVKKIVHIQNITNSQAEQHPDDYITFNVKNGGKNSSNSSHLAQNMVISNKSNQNTYSNTTINMTYSQNIQNSDTKNSQNLTKSITNSITSSGRNVEEIDYQETKNFNKEYRNQNKSADHSGIDYYYKKYDIETFVSPEDEQMAILKKQKKEEAIERCMMLYERAKIKNEVNKINYFKNMEVKESNELDGCTFQPHINDRKNKQEENLKLVYKNTKIYNRSLQWRENKQNKIEKNRREMMRETEETFQPKVNLGMNLNTVFYKNPLQKNDSSMNYVVRVMKHRKENEDRQKMLETTLSKKANKNWGGKKKQSLNSSMKELRDELHSYAIDSD